jgi:hypothetical protein
LATTGTITDGGTTQGWRTNDPAVDDLIESSSHVSGKDVVALVASTTVDEAA